MASTIERKIILIVAGGAIIVALAAVFFGVKLNGPTENGADTGPTVTHVPEEVPDHTSPVFLPGTQPHDLEEPIAWPRTCLGCHSDYGDYSPYDTWKGSMMSFAAMDPLFLALNAISNRDLEGVIEVGDYCLRCHAPDAWLAGRSEPVDGSAMTEEDIEAGVSCDLCHRLVDPFSEEGKLLSKPDTKVHANSQYVVSKDPNLKRGPYSDTNAPHKTAYSEFHTTSEICATCHDIYNPVYDLTTPVETTYSEWLFSDFSREGIECQDCHMPKVTGYACFASTVMLRDDIAKHEFAGASTWIIDAMISMYEIEDDRKEALLRTKELSIEMLKSAAELDLSSDGETLNVRITNLAGHKLPTGYPEGKRMWLNVKFYNSLGGMISESGRYDPVNAELVKDGVTKIYEAKPGTKGVSDHPDGPSFHFALNNFIYKDNRIPPRGFTNQEYEDAMAYIRGVEYEDGVNWDVSAYAIPPGASSATVTLIFKSGTREFLEFLRDENQGNKWDIDNMGIRVYRAWEDTGRAPPVEMATESILL